MASDPFHIFVARHDKDAKFADRLQAQIASGLYNMDHVQLRSPADILAGDNVATLIQKELNQAQFIILIISTDFLNHSEAYWSLACSLHKAPKSQCRIFPVLARPCMFGALELDTMADAALFNKDKPLSDWEEDDDTPYFHFAERLVGLINETEKKQTLKSRTPRDQKKFAQLLSHLNYTEQPNQFLDVLAFSQTKFASNKAFAYLIKGKYGYGQDWLYHILRQKTKESEIWKEFEKSEDVTYFEIPMSFSSLTLKNNPKAIWTNLGKKLKISSFASSEEVVNHICNKLSKTQIVVFRFENFGELTADMGKEFMANFWKEIVAGTTHPTDDKTRFPLFMFLIDQNQINSTCSDTFVSSNSEEWTPQCGAMLKELENLSFKVVSDWLFHNRHKISKFGREPMQNISQPEILQALTDNILKDTQGGIPERVLGKVSEKFNFRFLEILDQLAENE